MALMVTVGYRRLYRSSVVKARSPFDAGKYRGVKAGILRGSTAKFAVTPEINHVHAAVTSGSVRAVHPAASRQINMSVLRWQKKIIRYC